MAAVADPGFSPGVRQLPKVLLLVCEGYVFTLVCQSFCSQGACVVGGHVWWWWGACMMGGTWQGACMAGGCMAAGDMRGRGYAWQGVCMAGGHVWQGVCGGVCMAGGMHGQGTCMTEGMCGGVMGGRGCACHACPPPPTLQDMVSQCMGGMHPTGMHSCFLIFLPKTAWKWKNMDPRGARPWRPQWIRQWAGTIL